MTASDDGEEETDGGRLIDAQGRLFGLVNIVDALVVFLVAAVVVAGVVLLLPGGGGEPDSRFVTMDLGSQPEFVAEQISPGDTWEPDRSSDDLVITDVYRTAADNGTQVIVRARVNGTVTDPEDPAAEPVFEFLGDPLRTGGTYTLVTPEYEAEGQVTRIDQTGDRLQTEQTPFVLETTVSEATGAEIEVGDTFQLAGDTLATIETIERLPSGDNQRLLLGMQGQTIERDGTRLFGGAQLRVGAPVRFVGEGYELTGEVRQRGTTEPDRTSQSVVAETTVSTDTAETIAAGDAFTVGENTVATVESVTLYPAGETRRIALLGLELATVDDGIERFAGRPIRVGNTIPFQTEDYGLSATIRERGTTDTSQTDQSVVAETTISADTAEALTAGDEFRLGDSTIATIESVALYPAGETQRTALLGLELATIGDRAERFGNQPVRVGNTVPFRTNEYELSATIRERGTSAIETVERSFVVEATVPTVVAGDITAGDTFTLAGREIISVESVTSYATDVADQRRVLLGVNAAVREDGTELRFGEQRLRVGTALPIRTGEYDITGEIIDRGTLEEPGEQTTRSIVFGIDNVPPERAASLTVGLREQARGLTTAIVRDKTDRPAVIALTSEDGNIFEREHPINRDVELTTELTVRELEDGGLRFRGEPLRTGQQLTLELGSVRVTGEVFEITDE